MISYEDLVEFGQKIKSLVDKYGLEDEEEADLVFMLNKLADSVDFGFIFADSAYELYLNLKEILEANFEGIIVKEDGEKIIVEYAGKANTFYYDWFNAYYFFAAPADVYYYVDDF